MKNINIYETKDYEPLIKLFMETELEFSDEEPVPTDLVKSWKAAEDGTDRLVGGVVLAKRQGEYIIDGIAVYEEFRKHKVGRSLLETVVGEVKKRGGGRLFLVARAPGFFKKFGFNTVDKAEAPNFFECLTCDQYGVSCFPEVMVYNVEA